MCFLMFLLGEKKTMYYNLVPSPGLIFLSTLVSLVVWKFVYFNCLVNKINVLAFALNEKQLCLLFLLLSIRGKCIGNDLCQKNIYWLGYTNRVVSCIFYIQYNILSIYITIENYLPIEF